MVKLDPLSTLAANYASIATLNANFEKIEDAFENTVSRDGSSPNTMTEDFDMNSNSVINLPNPTLATEAVRKSYVDALALGGSVNLESPIGSTSTLFFRSDGDYATLALADAAAFTAGGLLVLDKDTTLTGNLTLTAPAIMFAGGNINLNNFILTINGVIFGSGQIFDITSGGSVAFASTSPQREVWAEWFGVLPGLVGPLNTALITAMNAAGVREVSLPSIGIYKFSGDIVASITSSLSTLKGPTPVRIWGSGYAEAIIASTNYNEAPTSHLYQRFAIFEISGDGFWGKMDTGSVNATTKRIDCSNICFYGRTGSTVPFHFAEAAGSTFRHCAFIQFGKFGVALRYCDTFLFESCDWLDNGYNLANSGSLSANGASTYGSGCNILLGSKTTAGDYFGNGGINKSTSIRFKGCTVWNRGDYNSTSFSGYRGVIGYNTGDCTFENCQIVSSCLFVDCFGDMGKSHVETYAQRGTSTGSSADLWAVYLYDSNVSFSGVGWLGTQFQIHNGTNASDVKGWRLVRGGTYVENTGVSAPSAITISPNDPFSIGVPSRFGDLGVTTVASIAGTAGNDNYSWPSVVHDGYGFHGFVVVSINLSSNKAARYTQVFLVNAQKGAAYASNVSAALSTADTFGGGYGVTLTPSFTHTASRQGLNLVVNASWTGANWTAGLSVDMDVAMIGGGVQSA